MFFFAAPTSFPEEGAVTGEEEDEEEEGLCPVEDTPGSPHIDSSASSYSSTNSSKGLLDSQAVAKGEPTPVSQWMYGGEGQGGM